MNESRISKILKIPIYFAGGFLFSLPYTGGTFSPFAPSFAAAAEGIYSIAAAAGSFIGICIFHSGLTSFRYFAVTIGSALILNVALRTFYTEKEKLLRILCPVICSFAVNFIFMLSQKASVELTFSLLCETLLCGVSVPVFSEAIKQIREKAVLNTAEDSESRLFVCFILSLTLMSAHLCRLGTWGKTACCFIFFFLILFFSQAKGFDGGIITGVCCSFVFAMSGEADFACVMFSLCGCICSFFNIKKRIFKSLTATVCAAAGFMFGEYTDFLTIVPAAAAAGLLFCIIPNKFSNSADGQEEIPERSHINTVNSNEIACAVESLSDCVNAVRKTLQPLITPELKSELIKTKEKVCAECELCESCVHEIRNSRNPCFDRIAEAFENGEPDFSCFPENFDITCYSSAKMLEEMKKTCFIHCANVSADKKINRMQALAGNQFRTFGGIIGQACEAASDSESKSSKFDPACAASAEEFGVKIKDARLCTDKAGREYFDISFVKPENNFSVTALTEKLGADTGYQLDFPALVQSDDTYDLIFKQKEKLSFNISAAVRPANSKKICGDYYRCFRDSFDRQVVLLSDGMGTGSRAAVDSAFTCETFCNLIKSGLDEKTAAAAVNCAMIMKSTDESFSTVDFLRIDPVLKTAKIFKCGAAPTFLFRKKKVSVVETESTPIGILDNVNMSSTAFEVDAGDIILMTSDGVADDRFNWICGELRAWKGNSASALAKHILQCAADRKIGKRADDMTVIAVCVAES